MNSNETLTIRILKLPVEVSEGGSLFAPYPMKILHFGEQGNKLYVWVKCWEDGPAVFVDYRIVGTGWRLNDEGLAYHSTVQTEVGLVWHLFVEESAV